MEKRTKNNGKGRPKEESSLRTLDAKKKMAAQKTAEAEVKLKEAAEKAAEIEAKAIEAERKAAEIEAAMLAKQREIEEIEAMIAEKKAQMEREAAEREERLNRGWNEVKTELDNDFEDSDAAHDTDSLADELSELLNGTATKEKNPEQLPEFEDKKTTTSDNTGDFDKDFEEPAKEPEVLEENENGNIYYTLPGSETAEMIIIGLDVLMKSICPFTYQRAFFSREEMRRVRMFRQRAEMHPKEETVYEEQDYILFDKMDEFLNYQENVVPLTSDEKKMLKTPLKAIFKDKKGQISPTGALIYAFVMIALPRFSPQAGEALQKVFTNFFNTIKDEE